jgi:hypothetical protein
MLKHEFLKKFLKISWLRKGKKTFLKYGTTVFSLNSIKIRILMENASF